MRLQLDEIRTRVVAMFNAPAADDVATGASTLKALAAGLYTDKQRAVTDIVELIQESRHVDALNKSASRESLLFGQSTDKALASAIVALGSKLKAVDHGTLVLVGFEESFLETLVTTATAAIQHGGRRSCDTAAKALKSALGAVNKCIGTPHFLRTMGV